MTDSQRLAHILGVVRTAARQLVGADGVTFVLREGDDCAYLEEDAIAPLWKGCRFPMRQCISGWVMMRLHTAGHVGGRALTRRSDWDVHHKSLLI